MFPTIEKGRATAEAISTATEAHVSGTIPFFNAEPLPGESDSETNARRAFLNKAGEAVAMFGIGLHDVFSFFVVQKNLLAEMKNNINQQSFESALWDMFESLMRDEMTALDTETRADACIIYRWLQRLTSTVYAV